MCSFAESGESEIQCLVGIMELAALQHVLPCAAGLLDIGISRLEHSLPNDTVLSWEYLQESQQQHAFVIKLTEIPLVSNYAALNFNKLHRR